MAEQLTPAQALAVKNRGGRLLVSAAAGSGKTKVLVDRLMTYLTDPNDPAQLDEFLVITYTGPRPGSFGRRSPRSLRSVSPRIRRTVTCKSSFSACI